MKKINCGKIYITGEGYIINVHDWPLSWQKQIWGGGGTCPPPPPLPHGATPALRTVQDVLCFVLTFFRQKIETKLRRSVFPRFTRRKKTLYLHDLHNLQVHTYTHTHTQTRTHTHTHSHTHTHICICLSNFTYGVLRIDMHKQYKKYRKLKFIKSLCTWHIVINALPCTWHNVVKPIECALA